MIKKITILITILAGLSPALALANISVSSNSFSSPSSLTVTESQGSCGGGGNFETELYNPSGNLAGWGDANEPPYGSVYAYPTAGTYPLTDLYANHLNLTETGTYTFLEFRCFGTDAWNPVGTSMYAVAGFATLANAITSLTAHGVAYYTATSTYAPSVAPVSYPSGTIYLDDSSDTINIPVEVPLSSPPTNSGAGINIVVPVKVPTSTFFIAFRGTTTTIASMASAGLSFNICPTSTPFASCTYQARINTPKRYNESEQGISLYAVTPTQVIYESDGSWSIPAGDYLFVHFGENNMFGDTFTDPYGTGNVGLLNTDGAYDQTLCINGGADCYGVPHNPVNMFISSSLGAGGGGGGGSSTTGIAPMNNTSSTTAVSQSVLTEIVKLPTYILQKYETPLVGIALILTVCGAAFGVLRVFGIL